MVLLNTVHVWSLVGVWAVGVADHFRVVAALLALEAWAAEWTVGMARTVLLAAGVDLVALVSAL